MKLNDPGGQYAVYKVSYQCSNVMSIYPGFSVGQQYCVYTNIDSKFQALLLISCPSTLAMSSRVSDLCDILNLLSCRILTIRDAKYINTFMINLFPPNIRGGWGSSWSSM